MSAARLFAASLIVLVLAGCEQNLPIIPRRTAEPRIQARVIEIRTVAQPENRTTNHRIVIHGDLARSTDELDQWRLFDLKNETVTFVDDLARTRRTEAIASLLQRRRRILAQPLGAEVPRAEFLSTGQTRPLLGVPAFQSVISAGLYRRELWIGVHPLIPPRLYAMMHISDLPTSSLAPMMQAVDAALVDVRGFPLADLSELPVGQSRMTVERSVIAVEDRRVPESWITIPADYRDTTQATERGAGRRPAS